MNYKFGVYGDSIAFGYGNNNQSWFDELYLENKSLKLAQNGEKIEDVLNKIKQDNNHYDTLFLAVGINDLLSTSPQSNQIAIPELIGKYKEILEIAENKASKVVVQSVLPAREELFPNQVWLDEDKWAFNSDIELFNQKLAELCSEFNILYLDAYSEFCAKNLAELYIDAVHLNKQGQSKLAMDYKNFIPRHFYFFRHGQTNENEFGQRYGTGFDAWLTDNGIAQANKLQEFFANKQIDVAYSSPLKRAIDTAKIAINNPNVKIITDDRLIEAAFGFWYSDDNSKQQIILENFNRIKSCLDDILDKDNHTNIVIASHGGVTRALCWACGHKVENIKNCECFHFILEKGQWNFIERFDTGVEVQNKSDITHNK